MQRKTIGIFTFQVKGGTPWDLDTINNGISGSEEAVIYVSQRLAEMGFQVFILGDPPIDSPYAQPGSNPRFLRDFFLLPHPIDIAISWRMPHLAPALRTIARKVYLWPHDILTDPLNKEQVDAFDDVLWLSEWQRSQWISIDSNFSRFVHIFGNGVNQEQFKPVKKRVNPYSCIYGSNYGRGLSVLTSIWGNIKREFPDATLDIYYGWQHWGALSTEEEKFLRKQIEALPDVREHGCVGHEELNRAYEAASFWTYPCTKPETFCITALRAQLAGAIPVICKNSALAETVRYGYSCFRIEDYCHTLKKALSNAEKICVDERSKMGAFILNDFTWKQIAIKYKKMFNS